MRTFESYASEVQESFEAAELHTSNLDRLALPPTYYAENGSREAVAFTSVGSPEAPNTLLTATPMFTELEDHFKLRMMATQAVLGDNYRVVGVEGFVPAKTAITKQDRKRLAVGDFGPISERILRAAEEAELDMADKVITYGYSLGADSVTQVTHDVLNDPNKGIIPVEGLIAVEAARTEIRGALAVGLAFMKSGNDFYDNVVASNSSALNEFWKIDSSGSKKAFNAKVNGGLMDYVKTSLSNNFAILRGFANDYTEQQINQLVETDNLPVFVGRHEESAVCTAAFLARLRNKHADHANFHSLELPGDHSSDDNIRLSAQRTRYAVDLLSR